MLPENPSVVWFDVTLEEPVTEPLTAGRMMSTESELPENDTPPVNVMAAPPAAGVNVSV